MPSIELKRQVRWADADAAGRLYFPRIFDYYAEAEAELMKIVGFLKEPRGRYDFPRVHAECKFKKALALAAPFRLRLSVGKLGRTSIRYDFQVFREGETESPAAEGRVTVVVMEKGKPVEIPPAMRAALSSG